MASEQTITPPVEESLKKDEAPIEENAKPTDSEMEKIFSELASPPEYSKADEDEIDFSNTVPVFEEREDPLQKMKASSGRLAASLQAIGADMDSKLGLSDKAKEIDEKVCISETTSKIGGWFSAVNRTYGISEMTKGIVKGVGQTMNEMGEIVKPVTQRVHDNVRDLDQKLGVTKTVADGVAVGADFLNDAIASHPSATEEEKPSLENIGENDKDYPSSFPK